MSRGKMHSPFETFWLFCLLFLNTEVLKIQLNVVLLWAGVVVSVLPISSLMVLPSFSIRYPEVGVRLKSSAGNSAKWAIEKPHNSCHSAHAVCWAAPALFPGHPPLLPGCSAFCRVPTSGGEVWCEPWQLLPAPRGQVVARVAPWGCDPPVQEQGEGTGSLLEAELLAYSPWHTLRRGFFPS